MVKRLTSTNWGGGTQIWGTGGRGVPPYLGNLYPDVIGKSFFTAINKNYLYTNI